MRVRTSAWWTRRSIIAVAPTGRGLVREGRQSHHAVGEVRQQQVGQREVAQVVGAELGLEAVLGAALGDVHDAGVVDEQVQVAVPGVGELAYGGEVGQVEPADLHAAVHRRGCGFAALGVPYGEDDVGARGGQGRGGGESEAAVGAGHDGGAAGLVGDVGGVPGLGVRVFCHAPNVCTDHNVGNVNNVCVAYTRLG